MSKQGGFFEDIIRRHVSPSGDVTSLAARTRVGYLEAWVSIIGNLLLAAMKVAFGLLLNSISLMADAVHTASDVVTSVVVLVGFRAAQAPADAEHPYGHGRVESLATMVIAVLLIIVGWEFGRSAIERFRGNEVVVGNVTVAILLAVSGLLKEWMARFSEYLGRRIDSSTLIADAWHHRSDAIASVLVSVALVAAALGYQKVDAVLGVVVAGLIVYTGFDLGRSAGSDLIGRGAGPDVVSRITEAVTAVEGVQGIHSIQMHNYGAGQARVTLHIEVRQDLHVDEAHEICEQVEHNLAEQVGVEATVHVEPLSASQS